MDIVMVGENSPKEALQQIEAIQLRKVGLFL